MQVELVAIDIILVDIRMKGCNGIEATRMINKDFLTQLNTICLGEVPLAPGLAKKLLRQIASEKSSNKPIPEILLTQRQKELLQFLIKGFTYHEISDILHIQTGTVQYHIDQLINKLYLTNRTQLIAWATKFDLSE